MHCNCAQYQPIELSRQSVNKRIRETKAIIKALVLVAENTKPWLKLFKCPACGQYWQTGHEWNFKDKEYIFQVPEVEVEAWLKRPYAQPAALMLYSATLQDYYEQNSFETGSHKCRVKNCKQQAIRLSACCQQHHIQQLQKANLLPTRPSGKLFPPYKYMSNRASTRSSRH